MGQRNLKLLGVLGISLIVITALIVVLVAGASPGQAPANVPEQVTTTAPTLAAKAIATESVRPPTNTPAAQPTETKPPTPTVVVITSTGNSPIPTPLSPTSNVTAPVVYGYTIINTYPHDRDSYTQGLIYVDGVLYEGSGLYGRSSLRRVDLESGQVEHIRQLPVHLFGEGITLYDDKIFQLTWKEGQGFVYDRTSFEILREFTYPTQGWGITHNGEQLIMSDGSATLYFWDPETLQEVGRLEVRDQNGPVIKLNELEYIQGEVFANIYQTDLIARIDPATGHVTGWIELSGLLTKEDFSQPVDVLNGIAYDAEADRLFITGKLWPKLFEIELVPYQ